MKTDFKVELSSEQEHFLKTMISESGKALLATMKILEIPNYIETTFISEGEKYTLRLEKHPVKERKTVE